MDNAGSNANSDCTFNNPSKLETFEYDESQSTQWMSRKYTGRRGRKVYGNRGSAASNSNSNLSRSAGFGEHQRSRTSDESAAFGMNLSSSFGIQAVDQISKPPRSSRRSNSVPFICDLGPDAFQKTPHFGDVGIACDTNHENAHPNLNRRESLSFCSTTASNSCFSSLSRSASLTKEASMNNFSSSTLSFSESAETSSSNHMSPSRNKAISRKRTVCESPVMCPDDFSAHGGISIGRNSTSSNDRRSRSRIFSPGSTKKMIDSALAADIYNPRQFNEESFNESDSDDEDDRDTSIMRTTSTDADGNEDADGSILLHNSVELERAPLRFRRLSSIGDAFNQVFDTPVEIKSGTRAHEKVFANMSSYDDLKFLIRELRKWNSGKQAMVFGMKKLCTVVLPSKWKHQRKTSFNQWVTTHFKFTLRSGGGNVSYLQTSRSNGEQVLKKLDAALLSYKESSKGNRPKPLEEVKTLPLLPLPIPQLPMSSVKISRSFSTPMMPILRRRSATTPCILPSLRSSLSK